MAVCCISTKVLFANEATTTIPYDESLQAQYGPKPRVHVWYYDPVTEEYYMSTFFTVVKFDGTNITVDHGGPASGYVVIM